MVTPKKISSSANPYIPIANELSVCEGYVRQWATVFITRILAVSKRAKFEHITSSPNYPLTNGEAE